MLEKWWLDAHGLRIEYNASLPGGYRLVKK
jgi:hypothetical protein